MRSVLVTGASSGIGAATALRLERAGWTVFAGVRDPAEAEPLDRQSSERLQLVTLDVTDAGSIAAAVGSIEGQLAGAGLDGVVNLAGQGIPGPLEILPIEHLRQQFEVNVFGQVAVTQAVLPLLRKASGRIVLVGSIGGKVAVQFAGPYHASKYAMEAIADSWRQELHPDAISVSLVEPGPIATPIWAKAAQRIEALLADPPAGAARYVERLRSFQDSLRSAGKSGASPEVIAEVIEQALTTGRPKARYAAGGGAGVFGVVRPLIPQRVIDAVARRTA